ncbi:MAG: glutamine-hydrolyzing carbamoyl-phosphate synthase small subunit [Candidatus Micrarchaeia archaeon]
MNKNAVLILSDGSVFFGAGFGAIGFRTGELVFNTSMQGYQEALTDPSYAGQILTLTYPLIGNYGLDIKNCESSKVWVSGFVVRELDFSSGLDKYLEDFGVGGIFGVDTREITKKIREFGVVSSCLAVYENEKPDIEKIIKNLKFEYSLTDFVSKVGTSKVERFGSGNKKVVLIDLGVKMGIIRELNKRGIEVISVPYNFTSEEIRKFNPSGVVISNGPGDPALLKNVHKVIRELCDLPMFGICLGHQCIAHAFGGSTYKLKFGHRGSNHPVYDCFRKKVLITTQNHGFAVSKVPSCFEVTHYNLLDNSNEGMRHISKPIFSVQFHPESCPGPNDSRELFGEFIRGI